MSTESNDRLKFWSPWFILLLVPIVAHTPEFGFSLSSDPLYFIAGLRSAPPDALTQGQPGWNDANTGFTTEALGGLAARQWLHGELPWWNPYSGVGMPLAAEVQSSALFLPFVLLLNAAAGTVYLKLCMQVVAGLATFALLRQLGMARRVALLGGILYQLNGTFAWMDGAPIMPVPFLPLLLLGIERALAHAAARRIGGWAWITVAIGYSLYAGFPETAFIDGLFAATWTIYRFATATTASRWRFSAKVVIAGVLALMLAAPLLLPFLQFLPQAYIGVHGVMAIALDPSAYAMFLVPYLLGPIEYSFKPWAWGNAGGYLTLPLALLATLALRTRGREVGLRGVLAGWIIVTVAVSAGLPGVTEITAAIPFFRDHWFYRFAVPSWEMAAVLLAAVALDDWHRGAFFGWRRIALAGAFWGVITLVALAYARPLIVALLNETPGYPNFLIGSLVCAACVATTVVVMVAATCTTRRSLLACGVLAGQAIALFALPLFAGPRSPAYDGAAVSFLQANLGFSRFYTLGPFAPNYGALFGTASINHLYLPVPRRWVDYVHTNLDPAADDAFFTGTVPEAPPGSEVRVDTLQRRSAAYQAVGVKYVLSPIGLDPFVRTIGIPPTPSQPVVQSLAAGQGLSGDFPGDRVLVGGIDGLAVTIGTYHGASDGVLTAGLCTSRECVDGSVPLAAAVDNHAIKIRFATALPVKNGDRLRYSLVHVTGDHTVAVWLWPQSSAGAAAVPPLETPDGKKPDYAPALSLAYSPTPEIPRLAYHDDVMNIHELPSPAGYFETRGGPCEVTPMGRQEIHTRCQAPGTLIRRELFFPGWHAEVNGTEAPIWVADQIFQAVQLAPGEGDVRFAYAPPYIGWAYAAFLGGTLGWLAPLALARFASRRKAGHR